MKRLKDVTIVCVDCNTYFEAISAMMKSLEEVKPDRALFLTDLKIKNSSFETVKIKKIKSKKDYSVFIIKKLYKYIKTKYVLIIQNDGWVLSGEHWDNRFYKYDYLGSKWVYPKGERNVGNGGFSFRTQKLLQATSTDDFIMPTEQEDDCICRMYGKYLEEKYDIRFAPESIADKFSFELHEPTQHTFGFHGMHHHPFRECVVIRRTAALGDVLMCESVLDYFSNKGYRVYLDTLPEFFQIFAHYNHIVKHVSELKQGVKAKVYDLDMTYERNPKQLVLKSYYDACGITDGDIRNSRLYLHHANDQKLFERYVVIHADDTGIPHRNINGLKWFKVIEFLKEQGYLIVQIGKRTSAKIPGAIQFNAATKHITMYLIRDAEMFIGLDSGLAQIAVAFNVPSVIFFGSVNPQYRYPNLEKIKVVHTDCPLNKDYYCYHEVVDWTVGKDCEVKKELPPCSVFSAEQVIEKIKELL